MRLMSFLIALCFILVTFSFVSAQSWDQAKGVGFTMSLIKFIGDQKDRAALGNWLGVSLKYGFSPYVMADLNVAYGSFKPSRAGSPYQPDPNSPYRTFLFPLNLSLKATPWKEQFLKPYLTVGLGLLLWDLRDVSNSEGSIFDSKSFRWGERVHGSVQMNPILSEGLGIEIYLTENLGLDLQGRFSTILEVSKDNVGENDFNDQIAEARATLTYYFGYYKDTDLDGIQDKFDADPFHAEDFDGFKDEDGIPDDDNDGDGVPDLKDEAPNKPEDIDGFQDEDGVPDPDNDGDFILDINDKCKDEKEDFDGFNDEDGCPDSDNDGDAIPDVEDKCPGQPETINGYEDDDGCPDDKPIPQVEKQALPQLEKQEAPLILEGVNFQTGSSDLTESSFAVLDKVIEGLRESKEVKIEIRGYTDSQGAEKTNQILSENRAKSVMQYLIHAGIEPKRLKAVGYGEENPIASNNTSAGRAKNRRIEFVRIQ